MSTDKADFFHRSDLACALADTTLDRTVGLSGGLFLAAPRRTGKSTFVRQDLVPEFTSRGHTVIYVDLWSDKTVDPAVHIAAAIRAKLIEAKGFIGKAMEGIRKVGTVNLDVFGTGVGFDLSGIGLSKTSNLTEALQALSHANTSTIILVVDEAQHALTTEAGMTALFSLKAARDSLNTDTGLYGMQMVATGSNRDKLASLVNSRDQAFYGADLIPFPTLGADYVKWVLERSKIAVDLESAVQAFKLLGNRPEPFRQALTHTRLKIVTGEVTEAAGEALIAAANAVNEGAKTNFLNTVSSLPPLQSALLQEIALEESRGPDVRKTGVFTAAMRKRLNARLEKEVGPDHGIPTEPSNVQTAMDKLREQSFLWRSQRGHYTLEDEQFIEWLR